MLQSEFNNGIGRMTLNRPEKRNALTRGLIEELLSEIKRFREMPELRLLVLAAHGKAFCAGMDLDEMQARAASADGAQEWHRDSEVYSQLLESVFSLRVPTVVKLQGPVLAGGVGLVLACDLIVASEGAFFSLPEPMRGITAAIVTPLLVHRVGAGVAGQLLLSGERLSARRAFEVGLVHDVVSDGELDQRLSNLENAILTGSPAALEITKRHLHQTAAASVVSRLRQSIEISAEARETVDAREGLAAFLEKRKPYWQP